KDAQKLLQDIIKNKRFQPRAAIGFWPAMADGDDVRVLSDEVNWDEIARLHFLRQQRRSDQNNDYLCLADFVAPDRVDYIGGFVVTAGGEVEEYAAHFEKAHDDYSPIMVKPLGDRFA